METVVIVLMALVMFNFVLKISFMHIKETMAVAVVAMLFVVTCRDWATEQSRTQIADWLGNQSLMLDTAVLLSIDVALQLIFCGSMAGELAGETKSKKQQALHLLLTYFPGLTAFVVMFSALVQAIFALPGTDFELVAWLVGGALFVAIPALAYGLKYILPEKDIRLELLFMGNICTAIFGIVATVNGKTAVEGNTNVEWKSLGGLIALTVVGALIGWGIRQFKLNRKYRNN